ncbi:MAG: arsenic resistance protein [bacterium]|nr:arsenic resistance protein [bacterium]
MSYKVTLEQKQSYFYLISILIGILLGVYYKNLSAYYSILVWPFLVLVLYTTFLQVPLSKLLSVFKNGKFILVLILVNFIAVPMFVFLLTLLFKVNNVVLIAIYLVLLTPCVDYVVIFTKLGKGDYSLLLSATPILLVLQILLLPVYLFLFLRNGIEINITVKPFVMAFAIFILLPLLLAFITEKWGNISKIGRKFFQKMDWLMVPSLCLTLIFIVASQISKLGNGYHNIIEAIPIYISYFVFAPLIGLIIAGLFKLPKEQKRTIAFSAGTRNSLVIMPIALSLPSPYIAVPAIIITQTILELIAEFIYIKIIPRLTSR